MSATAAAPEREPADCDDLDAALDRHRSGVAALGLAAGRLVAVMPRLVAMTAPTLTPTR